MEKIRHRIGHTVLTISLITNLILLGAVGIVWKTTWLDAPALTFLIKKNCEQGNLPALANNEVSERLFSLVCMSDFDPPL